MLGPDLAAHFDAVWLVEAFPQSNVEHGHVRPGLRDQFQSFGPGSSLTDDHHVVLGPEEVTDAAPDQLVIV
jgi:hypothetical protein